MAWSREQKALAARSCTSCGLDDDMRLLILRQFPAAVHEGRVTSTSPRLGQSEFEQFMAIVERHAGGQIKLRNKRGEIEKTWPLHHWQRRAEVGDTRRLRWLALKIDRELQQSLANWAKDGEGLRGWIESRVTHGRTDDLEQLTYQELRDLINGLRAYARRNRVRQAV